VFARLILDAGLQETVDMAHAMGVTSELPPVCALATGSVGITPLDQASGYQTIANGGVHCEPFAVATISRGAQLLYTHRPACERVLNRTVASVITDMMVGVVEHGTAAGPLGSFGPWPIAGKTGTANENTNVWFAGFTAQVSTAVWVGSQGVPFPLSEYFGEDVFGSTVAAPVWRDYMAQIMRDYDPVAFPEPELVPTPRVIGLTEAAARDRLREEGFKVAVDTIDSYLPAGTVAEQAPTPGQLTIPGTTVTIFVSTGEAPVSVVPNVVGLPTSVAAARLRAANFFVSIVEKPVDDPELDRVVLGQLPKPGTQLPEGSSVTLNIGAYEEGGGGGGGPSPSPDPDERRRS
jgi:membrane peptidoglycan carboxypeptidase